MNSLQDFDTIANAEADADGLIECVVLPLDGTVVFPNVITPIVINTPQARAAYNASADRTLIGVLVRASANGGDLGADDLYTMGTEIALGRSLRLSEDSTTALAQGRRRVEIVAVTQTAPYLHARARVVEEEAFEDELPADVSELMQAAVTLFRRAVELNENIPDDLYFFALNADDPGWLADLVASTLTLSPEERQALLEQTSAVERLDGVTNLLSKELTMLELREDINTAVQQEMDREQREVYLREQMRVIQTELGEEDIFQQELNDVRQQILDAKLPPEPHERALKELARLGQMPPMAPEVGMVRAYIDWLTALPWSKESTDQLDVANAQRVLDAEHYGLPKIKDRILEYIAVRKLAADRMHSPILCFVGPPGVGKTSLGKSIASALGRAFVRVSLGGVRDEAEIRGHRRTYIGALPGRILQTMRRAGTINPVFMLDEIDKLGADFRGDPSSALLEVLDPEQNHAFSDHYLEVPYDLSRVLFITTANDLDPLPPALLDRLEIIEFPGYTEEEKVAIARQFLIPRQLDEHGLRERGVSLSSVALLRLIREYTYEAGVRNLNREIANTLRKVARLVAEDKRFPKQIDVKHLEPYLGPPPFDQVRANDEDAVGVATGLAWTPFGGDILEIEVSVLPGKGTLLLTGQLGDVMQESAQAALSYMRARADDLGVPHDDFENFDIHVHLPEGAIPKDGPSAGITLAAAIISAFTEQPIRHDYGMTGEITLRGKVLPVGGVKEKILAARRARLRHVILPRQNGKDLRDVPREVLRDVEIVLVDTMQDVLTRVLGEPPTERRRDRWRQEREKQDEGEVEGEGEGADDGDET